MMAGRRDWKGAPEEMLEALSKFRDHSYATDWPSDSVSLAEALEELQSVLASVGFSPPASTMAVYSSLVWAMTERKRRDSVTSLLAVS